MFDVKKATTAELVAEYNRLSGKSIKKFSSRAAGEKQVTALLGKPEGKPANPAMAAAAKLEKAKQTKPKTLADHVATVEGVSKKVAVKRIAKLKADKLPADRSASIRRSWSVLATHNARSARHSVEVYQEGKKTETLQTFRSTLAAFEALGLPIGTHIKFRMELKAQGKNSLEHDGVKYNFLLVEKAEA